MIKVLLGDVRKRLREMPSESVDCVMTSPPYWALRDYGRNVETTWDAWDKKTGKCWNQGEHEWGHKILPRGSKSGKPGPNATIGARFAQDNARRGDGTVLDPFAGSGTTLKVARDQGKYGIGIELNPEYLKFIKIRLFGSEDNVPDDGSFEVIE